MIVATLVFPTTPKVVVRLHDTGRWEASDPAVAKILQRAYGLTWKPEGYVPDRTLALVTAVKEEFRATVTQWPAVPTTAPGLVY